TQQSRLGDAFGASVHPNQILLQQVNDAARRTTSLMRKGTFPAIAGNPAAGSHPFGMKGMMVTVATNVKVDPIAPSIPNLLSQKPRNRSAPNSHSETPRNQVAPRTPNAG